MYIRNKKTQEQSVNGSGIFDYKKDNLYSTAFPFDRCNNGTPGSIAFVSIHGYNGAVTTLADVWPQNTVRTFPTAGFTIGISSSSANDTSNGSGARTIEVDVLDTNYIPYTYTYTLTGQTKVTDTNLVGSAFRINDIRILTWGNGLANAGDIYVYDASDTVTAGVPQTATKIFSKIVATANTCRCGFYTVPAGCKLQTQQVRGGLNDVTITDRAAVLSLKYFTKTSSGLIGTYFPLVGQMNDTQPQVTVTPDFVPILDEKTDVILQATASASAIIAAYLDCILFYK